MNLQPRVAREHVPIGGVEVADVASEDVHHHRVGGASPRVAEGEIEDGPQVILELARDGALDCPVTGVVRPHREFVDEQLIACVEELDGEHAHHAELTRDAQGELLSADRVIVAQAGRGRDDLRAYSVDLLRLDHRVGHGLPLRRASDLRGELTDEGDVLLHQPRRAVCVARGERARCGRLVVHDPHALAVVAASRGLEHDRPAMGVTECDNLLSPRAGRPGRAGHSEPLERRSHVRLVLGMEQCGRAGAHCDATFGELLEDLDRHVLVVECDDVAAISELEHRLRVKMGADPGIAHDLGGRVIGSFCENPESNSQSGRRLGGHSRELPAADHADNGRFVRRHP